MGLPWGVTGRRPVRGYQKDDTSDSTGPSDSDLRFKPVETVPSPCVDPGENDEGPEDGVGGPEQSPTFSDVSEDLVTRTYWTPGPPWVLRVLDTFFSRGLPVPHTGYTGGNPGSGETVTVLGSEGRLGRRGPNLGLVGHCVCRGPPDPGSPSLPDGGSHVSGLSGPVETPLRSVLSERDGEFSPVGSGPWRDRHQSGPISIDPRGQWGRTVTPGRTTDVAHRATN